MRLELNVPVQKIGVTEVTNDNGQKLAVGDMVYYNANKETFTVKRGVVKEIHKQGRFFIYKDVVLTLEDGTTLKYEDSFLTKGEAISHAIEKLNQRIANRKMYIDSEMKEMQKDEKLLKLMMKHRKAK